MELIFQAGEPNKNGKIIVMYQTKTPVPATASVEDVLVKIRETFKNPSIRNFKQAVLKDGPRTFHFATLWEVIDPKTQNHHHYALRLDSVDHKKAGWFSKPEKSICLDGEGGEIERLHKFLCAFFEGKLPDGRGDVHVIGSEQYLKLEKLLEAIPHLASKDRIELFSVVLAKLKDSPGYLSDLVKTLNGSSTDVLGSLAIASRYVEYQKAFQEFESIIQNSQTKEADFQRFLEINPWIFGSEYSELLDRRTWVRDQSVDFMLRRTIDGFLEVIEIKRATGVKILQFDESHKCYYPTQALSQTIGQVCSYLETIEADRHRILAKDSVDPARIRARIVIGRDGTDAERNALHSLNSRLHRVEIMTYDQLKMIAQRTLQFFERKIPDSKVIPPPPPEDDLPF